MHLTILTIVSTPRARKDNHMYAIVIRADLPCALYRADLSGVSLALSRRLMFVCSVHKGVEDVGFGKQNKKCWMWRFTVNT